MTTRQRATYTLTCGHRETLFVDLDRTPFCTTCRRFQSYDRSVDVVGAHYWLPGDLADELAEALR